MSKSQPHIPPPGDTAATRPITPPRALLARAWHEAKEFSGLGLEATYLWPRWLVLRAVGLVFILVFAGIISDAQVLIGPAGLNPISENLGQYQREFSGAFTAFIHAPSLFWFNSGAGTIAALGWGGLLAAVALTLNLGPRLALFVCWVVLLSFVNAWGIFSGSQVDQLMLETALLCLPFAPPGLRPGLGAKSPPHPLALFMMRWLLFRVMFEDGLIKLIAGDEHWWGFTAMDVFYETAPFPTVLGFLDHQLPHAWHGAELALTFVAELLAPLLALFAGRRGRWFAIATWTALQVGIQLTNNFGWLNTASVGLGLLLLDDQMLGDLATKLRSARLAAFVSVPASTAPAPTMIPWRLGLLRVGLWTHFAFTLFAFTYTCRGAIRGSAVELPAAFQPITAWRSANTYTLYASFLPYRFAVEFEGSNDGGETWRTFDYRYQPQRENQISPFVAPWYPRFEATLQIQANRAEPSPLYATVATHLLQRTPASQSLFIRDPFPDRPPALIRIRGYQLSFVDLATHRTTGNYWRKQIQGDYLPLMYLNEHGGIATAVSALEVVRAHALHGNRNAQNKLGTAYAYGEDVPRDPVEAVRWFRRAAEQGHPLAQFFLGLSYAEGQGVPRDWAVAADYYRRSAEQGYPLAQLNLGFMHARGEGRPVDETEALVWFDLAARSGHPDAIKAKAAFERRVGAERAASALRRSELLAAEIAARLRLK